MGGGPGGRREPPRVRPSREFCGASISDPALVSEFSWALFRRVWMFLDACLLFLTGSWAFLKGTLTGSCTRWFENLCLVKILEDILGCFWLDFGRFGKGFGTILG